MTDYAILDHGAVPPLGPGSAGKFLRLDETGLITLWDGVNNVVPVPMVANAGSLTIADSGNYSFEITGALTAAGLITATLLVPTEATTVVLDNQTTGGFPVTILGIWTVPPGISIWYWNGSTFEMIAAAGYRTAAVAPFPAPASLITVNHLCGVVPSMITFELVCVVADAGYAPGDIVTDAETQGAAGYTQDFTMVSSTTTISVRVGSVGSANVLHKTTGASTAIVPANWSYRFFIRA